MPPPLSPSLSASPSNHFSSTDIPPNLTSSHPPTGRSHLMAAQKTEKEDADFKKVPESSVLTLPCINNCGLSGSPSTNNFCPTCFHASSSSSSSERAQRSSPPRSPERSDLKHLPPSPTSSFPRREVNRCSGCRRKVGLTGFRCRCGELFCGDHRYSDRHDCGYDYKAAGRDAIARENPIIKAAKIVRV